ncbi:3-keto-5-aminohexanoate cleavage protein [Roseomonas sp. KE2513]|uniref:3-keto-5-aminohexanoate cleavage protein n=1 Tax=Roseomonas sp. KE2513 TaxID=2479202 RepID=UPI002107FCEF|nr:3-keto-5-aminohexanoate cleavage protein [Roseomonas sp. KE2513]MBI0538797.1 3-keto-5-aminohexanoate cleavage protein [Roseomonas sp. KE2513]
MGPRKVIVTVAPTGGMASKKQNPNLPTQPEEIAEAVFRSYKEGAAVAALHARRPDDEATCDPAIYGRMNDMIRERCDIVINNSTGGGINGDMVRELPNGLWEIAYEERLRGIEANPEMATLDAQTVVASFGGREILVATTPTRCEEMARLFKERGVKPEWEVFSPEHILQDVTRAIEKGLDKPPYFINMVLGAERGFQGAMPYTADTLQMMVRLLPPQTIFCVSAIGSAQLPATTQAILLGGHVRVGLEDNNYYAPGQLATNEQLVARTVRILGELGHEPASASEAREMIGLPGRSAN